MLFFVWFDALIYVHRFSGSVFVVWLLAIGFMLFSGRGVERLFIAKFGAGAAENQ